MRAARERELLRAAEHAVRLFAAELALLDLETAFGDDRADLGEHALEAGTAVRRAADDLDRLRAVRNGGLVQVRALDRLAREHFAYDEGIGQRFGSGGLDRLDLQTAAGQTLGQLGNRNVGNIDKLVQPTNRKSHGKRHIKD